MHPLQPSLDWIDAQLPRMRQTLIDWANHNSYTYNVEGVRWMAERVRERLKVLDSVIELVEVPPAEAIDDAGERVRHPLGPAVRAMKRRDAKLQLLFNIHIDTVYPLDHPFQQVREIDSNTLNGPGVVDAKGGLVILLTVLEALEQSPIAKDVGWEVLINPDEEIGSPSSAPLLVEAAKRNHYGLLFEPAMADGSLVGARKGSGTFTFIVHGKAAHSGRDFNAGRNAIVAAAELSRELNRANGAIDSHIGRDVSNGPGVTFNIGKITGGGASNVVPDKCVVTMNVRAVAPTDLPIIDGYIQRAMEIVNKMDGIRVEKHGEFRSPPKVLDEKSFELLQAIIAAGEDLGLSLDHKSSGGASDGNKLAAAGLPVIDSMGPRGGKLHSPEEFVVVDSLTERAKLTLLAVWRLAAK